MSLVAIAKELLIAAGVGMVCGASASWVVQGWRMDALKAELASDKAEAIAQEVARGNQISSDYAEVVRWLNEQKQGRTVTVIKELEKAVYRDAACVLPESGRVLVNDAVRQANAARFGRPVLPEGSGDPAGGDRGRSSAVVDVDGRGLRGLRSRQGGPDQVGH